MENSFKEISFKNRITGGLHWSFPMQNNTKSKRFLLVLLQPVKRASRNLLEEIQKQLWTHAEALFTEYSYNIFSATWRPQSPLTLWLVATFVNRSVTKEIGLFLGLYNTVIKEEQSQKASQARFVLNDQLLWYQYKFCKW